jgi:hypothetical protein
MSSNDETVGVATWRDYDPEAAAQALKEAAKAEKAPVRAADKKES